MRAPARCVFLKGDISVIGRASPLRETTSAAYGISLDAVAEALPGDCHPMHCPQLFVLLEVTLRTMQRVARPVGGIGRSRSHATVPVSGGLPGEEGLTPHAPSERSLSVSAKRLRGPGRRLGPAILQRPHFQPSAPESSNGFGCGVRARDGRDVKHPRIQGRPANRAGVLSRTATCSRIDHQFDVA